MVWALGLIEYMRLLKSKEESKLRKTFYKISFKKNFYLIMKFNNGENS